jgi:hypothetical protein
MNERSVLESSLWLKVSSPQINAFQSQEIISTARFFRVSRGGRRQRCPTNPLLVLAKKRRVGARDFRPLQMHNWTPHRAFHFEKVRTTTVWWPAINWALPVFGHDGLKLASELPLLASLPFPLTTGRVRPAD